MWVDYSRHPATKLGLHNALLSEHDRVEILMARGEEFEVGVFVMRDSIQELLSDEGAERLFRALPAGDVKWIDLCNCLLPPVPDLPLASRPSALPSSNDGSNANVASIQLGLFSHAHPPYDEAGASPEVHLLDTRA